MELRKMTNDIIAVGTLKSKNLEVLKSKKGDTYIKGNLILEVKDGDEINELKFDVYSMEFTRKGEESKSFKAFNTIKNEYKTIDLDGEDADRITIFGDVGFNEYTSNSTGEYNKFQVYNVRYASRLKKEQEDSAIADFEMVITEIKEGEDTTKLTGLCVGFNNKVFPIEDVVVPNKIFAKMKPYYKIGETVRIQCTLHNSVIIAEEESVGEMVFGDYEPSVVKEFVNEIRFKGGKMPYEAGTKEKVSPEDFEFIKTTREQDYMAIAPVESDSGLTFGDDVPFTADDFDF